MCKEMEDRTARNGALSEADRVELENLRERGSAELDAINWLGRDFAKWMIDDRLVELLFSAEFLHTETLKRCAVSGSAELLACCLLPVSPSLETACFILCTFFFFQTFATRGKGLQVARSA